MKFWEPRDYEHVKHVEATEFIREYKNAEA